MADQQTYTVDNSPQTETMSDNLTADEQDSLPSARSWLQNKRDY